MPLPFDPSALSRYGSLGLVARTLVEGFLTGVHKSPFKGSSVEFAEHRPYARGDDIRRIDWRVCGKTDRYYIKEFEEETNARAYLLLDASGSMAYKGRHPSKFDHARHIAASLAYLMLHQLDAVGLVTLDSRLRQYLPPRASPKHLQRILRILEDTEPGGETALAPLWHELASQRIRRRGVIVVLSDCFDDVRQLVLALKHFRHKKHEVILFHILAPEELEFPFSRPTQFQNVESAGDRRLIDPVRLRAAYRERIESFCSELRSKARGMGVDYLLVRTDEPVERTLGAYLSARRR